MSNREQARKLRKSLAEANKTETEKAMASRAQNAKCAEEMARLQEELDNTKLALEELKKEHEELASTLLESEAECERLEALVAQQSEELKAASEAVKPARKTTTRKK